MASNWGADQHIVSTDKFVVFNKFIGYINRNIQSGFAQGNYIIVELGVIGFQKGHSLKVILAQRINVPVAEMIGNPLLNNRLDLTQHHYLTWAYGVVVSMLDFHRSDLGPNPGRGGKIS